MPNVLFAYIADARSVCDKFLFVPYSAAKIQGGYTRQIGAYRQGMENFAIFDQHIYQEVQQNSQIKKLWTHKIHDQSRSIIYTAVLSCKLMNYLNDKLKVRLNLQSVELVIAASFSRIIIMSQRWQLTGFYLDLTMSSSLYGVKLLGSYMLEP